MYFILGIGLFYAGWKLTGGFHDPAGVNGEMHFTVYHTLYVAGFLSFAKGVYKWVTD